MGTVRESAGRESPPLKPVTRDGSKDMTVDNSVCVCVCVYVCACVRARACISEM
jgi:hypothetical protein